MRDRIYTMLRKLRKKHIFGVPNGRRIALEYRNVIAGELSLNRSSVESVLKLMDEGATIPFIARYRKEASGGMDEVVLASVRDLREKLAAMDQRRKTIISSLSERNLLTDELEKKIADAETLTRLEDIYLPFRPKRKTRASRAYEMGLEPLADQLLMQENRSPEELAENYVNIEKGVENSETALSGARDIIAERITLDSDVRAMVREHYMKHGVFKSRVIKGKEKEGSRYQDWFDWSEKVSDAPSHRVLAMRRGEKELFLNLSVQVDHNTVLSLVQRIFPVKNNLCGSQVLMAMEDGLKRLLCPQMETEVRLVSKEKADREAVRVFAMNLRELLMAPPLGQKAVLAVDPGFRTGCKTVCLDGVGRLLEHTTIYPHTGKADSAAVTVRELLEKHRIECIAVGNGTAGRETESFLKNLETGLPLVMVNESGASIYSASELAREEFPELDLTVRGAISIGRRLQDPLAELVKIDPGSVGVGQYQHDVDQKLLRESLDDTVVSCVNRVGVNVNTASAKLLSYVSGLSGSRASSMVEYRDSIGGFKSRSQLLKVAGIGPVAYQQSAGFLRIPGAMNPLDGSAVHPESYFLVEEMARDAGTTVEGLISDAGKARSLDLGKYVTEQMGIPTLMDILTELEKPGRDPRSRFEAFSFADVHSLEDLKEGMSLPGIVTNVTDFGAFVDVGVHTDGLVHISCLSKDWIRHPSEVVRVGMKVNVTVTGLDEKRRRISLSMV